jgi:lipid A 3-O-deacylase
VKKNRLPILLFALGAGSVSAAPTHWIIQSDTGDRIRSVGFGAAFRGFGELAAGDRWRLGHHWVLGLSRWGSKRQAFSDNHLWDAWTANVLRMEFAPGTDIVPYAELGLGAHALSKTRIHARRFSTAFQFGEHLALGVRFGPRQSYSVALRLSHVSNASIKSPNDGVTFTGLELQVDWQ